jgi:hypothetical protein
VQRTMLSRKILTANRMETSIRCDLKGLWHSLRRHFAESRQK